MIAVLKVCYLLAVTAILFAVPAVPLTHTAPTDEPLEVLCDHPPLAHFEEEHRPGYTGPFFCCLSDDSSAVNATLVGFLP